MRTAEALTFLSLFAVVPLLTVLFAMLSVVPAFSQVGGDVQTYVFSHFLPNSGEEIQTYLLMFSEQARKLTGIGIVFLTATALAMLTRIEKEFNAIWRTRGNRTGLSSFLRYWAILSLGPLCIGLAIGISTYLASLHLLFDAADIFGIRKFLFLATPYALTAAAFTLLFAAIPNCRVPLRYALLGGAFSALCFEIAKYAFAHVMANASYQLIYGTFAAIPLLLLWIYTSWVIVLAGAEFVHALDNYSGRDSQLPNWLAALAVLETLWRKHRQGAVLRESELLRQHYLLDRFTLSAEHWSTVRDKLLDADLIKVDNNNNYLLSRSLQHFTLWELCELFTLMPRPLDNMQPLTQQWLRECDALLRYTREQTQQQCNIALEILFERGAQTTHLSAATSNA
jgi:membrane protein